MHPVRIIRSRTRVLGERAAGAAEVLVARRAFAAPRLGTLLERGFRAVVARSFGERFRRRAWRVGILPVAVDTGTHAALVASPGATVTIDLAAQTLDLPDGTRATFPVDPIVRWCLLCGVENEI